MDHKQWARASGLAVATLTGLVLALACLRVAAAQAAGTGAPAAAQTWFVKSGTVEGLVGYWKLDQVFDQKTFNATPLTFQSILTGGASITIGVPNSLSVLGGFPDFGALELNGVNGSVVVSDNLGLDVAPNSFTIAAWVRRVFTGTSTADLIYDSGTQTGHWYFGFLGAASGAASQDHLALTVNGVKDYTSTLTVTDSNWHHVAAVVSGSGSPSKLTLFLDGVPSAVISAVITTTPSGAKLIGNKNGSLNTPFDGDIDELRLYNRALSTAEVARLAAGKGCVADGTSWAAAFGDLQCAIQAAAKGDQVWLAQGTYHPGTAPQASFRLLNDISLLGGFLGTETSPAQRPAFNPNAPLTGLSGDAAGDDLPDTFGNYGDNACNVVTTGLNNIPGSAPNVTLDGLVIEDGHAKSFCGFQTSKDGGGLTNFSAPRLSLNNVVFQANSAENQGGGLSAATSLDFNSVTFSRNRAAAGGALALGSPPGILATPVTATLTALTFTNNTATAGGGALAHIDGPGHSQVTITGSTFTGNQAAEGGAIDNELTQGSLDLRLTHDTFSNNQATVGQGGALLNLGPAPGAIQTRLSQSTFANNTSQDSGGAIFDQDDLLTVDDSLFNTNSSALNDGGAIAASNPVTITNSTFESNTATLGGAMNVSALVMSGTDVILNRAIGSGVPSDFEQLGGGVFAGTAAITNSRFLSNTAFAEGLLSNNLATGGGLATSSSLALSGSTFQFNGAEHGGGVDAQGSATIQNSLFVNNSAGSGGGVFAQGGLLLFNNRLVDNTALEELTGQPAVGGGLVLENGNLDDQVAGNLFLGNSAISVGANPLHGAAMSLNNAGALVSNNTIVDRALNTVSAVSVADTTGATGLFNNIVASYSVGIEAQGGLIFVDYDLFSGDTLTHTGVVSDLGHSRVANAQFLAPARDDYGLRLNSPAIDAGDNNRVPAALTTDLNGGPRFANVASVPDTGAGTPPIVDIGAFEVDNDLFLPLALR